MVRMEGASSPIPLKALGDGISRMLGIVLSLVSSRDGLLLIDEVENGIYYEVQEEMWSAIFSIATRLNVQVVATTHSSDAIRAFSRAAAASADDGYVYRLEHANGIYRTVMFDESELATILNHNIELR